MAPEVRIRGPHEVHMCVYGEGVVTVYITYVLLFIVIVIVITSVPRRQKVR